MPKALLIWLAIAAGGCVGQIGGDATAPITTSADGGSREADLDAPPAPDAAALADGAPVAAPAETVELVLANGAFPSAHDGLPNAIVYIPTHFDASLPLDIFVYLHGWSNCIRNVIRDTPGTCEAGGPAHNSYALLTQLEASAKNAILLVPELAFEQQSSAIGKLSGDGSFRALVDEALGKIAGRVGGRGADDVDQLIISSHSGAYTAAAAIVAHGGMAVAETWLLDSLYGDEPSFAAWIRADEDAFRAPFANRFVDIYTTGGGTLASSQAMATTAASWFAGDASVILDDRTTDTLAAGDYQHGLIYKHSALAHDDVPRYYIERLLMSSRLPDRP